MIIWFFTKSVEGQNYAWHALYNSTLKTIISTIFVPLKEPPI